MSLLRIFLIGFLCKPTNSMTDNLNGTSVAFFEDIASRLNPDFLIIICEKNFGTVFILDGVCCKIYSVFLIVDRYSKGLRTVFDFIMKSRKRASVLEYPLR